MVSFMDRQLRGVASSLSGPAAIFDPTKTIMRTGIGEFDSLCGGGMSRGDLVVICGNPGSGKTELARRIATRITLDGHGVVYVTPTLVTINDLCHDKKLIGADAVFIDYIDLLGGDDPAGMAERLKKLASERNVVVVAVVMIDAFDLATMTAFYTRADKILTIVPFQGIGRKISCIKRLPGEMCVDCYVDFTKEE